MERWVLSFPSPPGNRTCKQLIAVFPCYIDPHICYFFDFTPTCSAEVISGVLDQTILDIATWTPTEAECDTLLEEEFLYLETVATELFGSAITKANAAGVTNFELLAQAWVLRVVTRR